MLNQAEYKKVCDIYAKTRPTAVDTGYLVKMIFKLERANRLTIKKSRAIL